MCRFVAIFSCSPSGVIGDASENDLVLRDKEDFQHFRNTTMKAGVLIMGRKTVESLPMKLEGRTVICLTRDKNYKNENADAVVNTVDEAVSFAHRSGAKVVMICGGSQIYERFNEVMDGMIVSHFRFEPDVQGVEVKNPVLIPDIISEYMEKWPSVSNGDHDFFEIREYRRPVQMEMDSMTYPEEVLVRNSIITPDGTEITSTHRHDFVSHTDKNGKTYAVDGGNDYTRVLGDLDYKDTSLRTDKHRIARWWLTWGTYGKSGNEPYKRVPVARLTTDHISAILDTQKHIDKKTRQCLLFEMLHRLTWE